MVKKISINADVNRPFAKIEINIIPVSFMHFEVIIIMTAFVRCISPENKQKANRRGCYHFAVKLR